MKKTIEEWKTLFSSWSTVMNRLYPNKDDRHNALNWDESPAYWMVNYNEAIYNAWSEYDVGSPDWDKQLKKEDMVWIHVKKEE